MYRNYVRVALRSLRKQKGYTAINISGLALGLAACMLIVLYVRDEVSYDQFHDNAPYLYRTGLDVDAAGFVINAATSPAAMARVLVDEYPEVVQATRFDEWGDVTVRYEDRLFTETTFLWTDSTVFDLFSYPLVRGDAQQALAEPNTIVLTQAVAQKYFGDADPIGRTLNINGTIDLRVTGVLAEIPHNTHLNFTMLGSLHTLSNSRSPNWMNNSYFTYIQLDPQADPATLTAKLPALVEKYVAPNLEQMLQQSYAEAVDAGLKWDYYIEPVSDIYLHSEAQQDIARRSDATYVYTLGVIAVFILLIACINFMNLSTARSSNRAKEVGLRKVLGSDRKQLMAQFLGESVLVALIALSIALALVASTLPFFNTVADKNLTLSLASQGGFVLAMIGVALGAGVLAGLYPALVLSAFRPAAVLKGAVRTGARGGALRSTLVVTQFAISIALLIGTGVVFNQLSFLQNTRLGFNKEQVVVMPVASQEGAASVDAFRQTLLANPSVLGVAAADAIPGRLQDINGFQTHGTPNDAMYPMAQFRVTHEYLDMLDVNFLEGRNFSRDFATDTEDAYIVNEEAVRLMGLTVETAVGTRIGTPGQPAEEAGSIVGVVENFHIESMHREIKPLILQLEPGQYSYVLARIDATDLSGTLAFLETSWKAFEPTGVYEFFFLDQDFERLYAQEERLGQIFGAFTAFAIFIACLGLFGLASFITEQRTKEIGVRKVLGASVTGIVVLLSKEFTKLVLVASVVAFPIGYYAMNAWVQNFAYHITIGPGIFLLAGVAALLIAWLTVSYQSIKAAISDPIKALRYE